MAGENRGGPPTQVLIACAALVIVIAGIQAASNLVTPLLVAVFLAVILAIPVSWLQSHRIPKGLAVLLVTLAMVGVVIGLGAFIGAAVGGLLNAIPNYQVRLNQQFTHFLSWLRGYGLDVSMEAIRAGAEPGRVMQLIGGLLAGLGGLVSNGVLILLVMVFILLEADSLLRKVRAAFGQDSRGLQQIDRFFDSFKVYVAIKTLMSLATGLLVWGLLAALAIEFASVWGLLAFLLNYIPNIGSIIAAVPAVLLALVQFGPLRALVVILGYLVVNNVLGVVVEPRLMGRGVGLSALVVFLSLILWAWVLGPVGMVLAVPLMVGLKLALEVSDSTRWLAILMAPAIEVDVSVHGKGDPGSGG
jgi:predicted PurR-regulated permease PerM